MSSGPSAQAANRNLALRELKFKKTAKPPLTNGNTSSGSTTASGSKYTLPTQSRDGSVRSPYFLSNPPATTGTILAPDSSSPPSMPSASTNSDMTYTPHRSHFFDPVPPPSYMVPTPAKTRREIDPLMAPSGFTTSFPSTSSSGRTIPDTPWSRQAGEQEGEDDEDPGPPRKRINRGYSAHNPIILESSPEQARSRAPNGRAESLTVASDSDEFPDSLDLLSGSRKSRLVRGRRPQEMVTQVGADSVELNRLVMTNPDHSRFRVTAAYKMCGGDVRAAIAMMNDPLWTPPEEEKKIKPTNQDIDKHMDVSMEWNTEDNIDMTNLNRFIQTHPTYPKSRITAAYKLSDGDIQAATGMILDPHWIPPKNIPLTSLSTPPPSSSVTPSASGGSGNKRRAEEKEKGKKSMIYAKRQALPSLPDDAGNKHALVHGKENGVVPQTQPSPIDLTTVPSSPLGPKPSKRKATRRIVDSSGSEAEYSEGYDSDVKGVFSQNRETEYYEAEAVKWFNDCEPEALVELAGITPQQADTLISLRPFPDAEDFRSKLSRKNKTGLSPRILDFCSEIFKGYKNVDDVLEGCERVGDELRKAISRWSQASSTTASASGESTPFADADGALALDSLPAGQHTERGTEADYISTQPSLLAKTVQLKEYQLLGVNWMNLLYRKGLSCILADEMGLGKTIQVIAFLALLKERGSRGPHLIIVPSSTLENWIREFDRFAPPMEVQAYYGSQKDRIELRSNLIAQNWDVLITTYNLAQGDERDRKFFRKFDWQCCIFDEGHVLKNYDSQRYHHLMKIESNWRLLLTGTPLQNNLQELVSLMNFILPRYFAEVIANLRAIFKVKADKHLSLLSRDRVSRAKKMMTPFVLRRRKDMVLKDLPKKTERIEWCEMTSLQRTIYRDALQRSRKAIMEAIESTPLSETGMTTNGKGKKRPRETRKSKDTSTNVLMDLRKAASHPMLFRRLFKDSDVKTMARQCMKEPEFSSSNYNFIVEDMEVMTDAELQMFSLKYKSTRKFAKEAGCFLDAGKISTLLSLLDRYDEEGRRVLIFSQFTQILDILQNVLKYRKTKFLVLTGSTAVDVRQSLVDEFNEDDSIGVFLLSTKAGGMGINLTAASVVVIFDQDFNPHNDRQAADRAYRIGQRQDVEVIKLITRSTIEEDMLRLGQTKLALDEAVAGEDFADGDGDGDEKAEKKMRTSLLSLLRDQFEKEQQRESRSEITPATNYTMDIEIEGGDKEVIIGK